jgi:hypothetical protein
MLHYQSPLLDLSSTNQSHAELCGDCLEASPAGRHIEKIKIVKILRFDALLGAD